MLSRYPKCSEQQAHLTFKTLVVVICTAKFNCVISTQRIIIPTKKSHYLPIQHSQTSLSNEAHCIICQIGTRCVYIRCWKTCVFNKAVPYLRRLIAGLSPGSSMPGTSMCHLHVNTTLISSTSAGIEGHWTQYYFHLVVSSSNCHVVTHTCT